MPESKSGALPLGDIPISFEMRPRRTHKELYHGTIHFAILFLLFFTTKNEFYEETPTLRSGFVFALPIFPGSRPPSIVGVHELNFCVRDGNRWTLMTINTNSYGWLLTIFY